MKFVKLSIFNFVLLILLLCCSCGNSGNKSWFSNHEIYREINQCEAINNKIVVELPNGYKDVLNDIEFTFEFPKDTYKIGEVVEMRVQIFNGSSQTVYFAKTNDSAAFIREDDLRLLFELVNYSEWVQSHTAAAGICELSPGEKYVYERAVALPSHFFDANQNYKLGFDIKIYSNPLFTDLHIQYSAVLPIKVIK